MSGTPGNGLEWVARASGVLGLLAGLYAVGAKLFSFVTRQELAKITAAQNRQFLQAQNRMQAEVERRFEEHRQTRVDMHAENRQAFDDLFKRTAGVEQGQARIEGRIDGLLDQMQGRER